MCLKEERSEVPTKGCSLPPQQSLTFSMVERFLPKKAVFLGGFQSKIQHAWLPLSESGTWHSSSIQLRCFKFWQIISLWWRFIYWCFEFFQLWLCEFLFQNLPLPISHRNWANSLVFSCFTTILVAQTLFPQKGLISGWLSQHTVKDFQNRVKLLRVLIQGLKLIWDHINLYVA